MRKFTYVILALLLSSLTYAGGNPEYVSYPQSYKSEFTHYNTRNRVGKPQIVDLYANKIAMETAKDAKLANGSRLVMEIYKANLGEDGNPITGEDGNYEKGKLAAIAVMEKNNNWDPAFDASNRAGDWGFALYNTDGTAKDNELDCASCHTPMPESDFLFSYSSLLEFIHQAL
jgi:cytochrome P460